jgi:hypothetical protein
MEPTQTKSDYAEMLRGYNSVNEAYNAAKVEHKRREREHGIIRSELDLVLKISSETVEKLRSRRVELLYQLNEYQRKHT